MTTTTSSKVKSLGEWGKGEKGGKVKDSASWLIQWCCSQDCGKICDLKDVDARSYVAVSRKEMGRKLESLKKRHGNDLYVKVNIPEKSNLSYNEAWTFTNEILSRYDYYHQQ